MIEVVHDKYASCLKDKSIGKEFHRLLYTIKLANFKAKELEQNVLDDDEENQIARGNRREIVELDSVLELLELFPYRLVFQTGSIFVMDNLNELLCSFEFVA